MIEIDNLSVKIESGSWSRPICFQINGGQWLRIVGASGSGKTRAGLAICGLLDPSLIEGSTRFEGRAISAISEHERSQLFAWVPSDPTLVFSGIKPTLEGELDLAWQVFGEDGYRMRPSVDRIVEFLGIRAFLPRNPLTLSGGEAVRAAIAISIVKGPAVIVLDQAFEALDRDWISNIKGALRNLLPASVVVETASDRSKSAFDELSVSIGDLSPTNHQAQAETDAIEIKDRKVAKKGTIKQGIVPSQCLEIRDLTYRYPEGSFQLGPVSFSIPLGECVGLKGLNGSGKTTLLRCLSLLLEPKFSKFSLQDAEGGEFSPPSRKRLHEWARFAPYVFQNPDDQLYLRTVREEIAENCVRSALPNSEQRVSSAAQQFQLTDVLSKLPHDLPRPVRRLITLASAFATDPPLMLLDEPSAQLDGRQTRLLVSALYERSRNNKSTIIVSHDESFLNSVVSSSIHLYNGEIDGATTN